MFLSLQHTRRLLLPDVVYGTYFILFSDLIVKFAIFVSISFAVICCFSKYYVLRIASWNGYIIDEVILVTARSKAWVCGRLFAWDCEFVSNQVHPFLYLVSVVFCHLVVPASV